ncbi:MAG: antibiotic biosynthesis monooxygenase [Sutterellaceae bacterium]|nr:antibiotic biosynthesis monooxygenase [Sutterellaceae bacterium]
MMEKLATAAVAMTVGLSTTASALEVRMAEIYVKPDHVESFKEIVNTNMRLSVEKEEGVISIYAVQDKNDPTHLTFFEIYADHDAYLKHTQTEHFKNYIAQTKDLAVSKKLIEVNGAGLYPDPVKSWPQTASTQGKEQRFMVTVRITDKEKVAPYLADHMAYLQKHFEAGDFLMFGPYAQSAGGWLIAKAQSRAALDELIAKDPLTAAKGGVEYSTEAIRVGRSQAVKPD